MPLDKQPVIKPSLLGCLVLLAGCDTGGPFSQLSNYELQQRHRECVSMASEMAPSTGITCGNIERECRNRNRREGRQICF